MRNLKILLVDDEYLALNLLEEFAKELPELEIIGKTKSPIQALDILQKETVNILFLDIQMPVLSGTNLLKTLKNPPVTIFTTAYSEYAVEAFDLNAVDYLLKPFSFERFLQSINKAKDYWAKNSPPQYPEEKDYLIMKVDGKIEKIKISDIVYIEGLKEYVKIVTTNRQYVALESMKNLEDTLEKHDFIRTHRSYIVSKKRAQSLEGNLLDLGAKIKIPISRERKEYVVKMVFGL